MSLAQLQPLRLSREYVRLLAHTTDKYQIELARKGRMSADKNRAMRRAGVLTTRPLERVEIDNFLLDVHVVCEETGRNLGRPWLTAAVDHYSGVLLGYYLTFAAPSATSVLGALRHAIYPKPDVEGLPRWPCYGVMDTAVMDNGSDMASHGVHDALDALGMEVLFCPPGEPWYKGVIERFGRTANMRLFHWLPGSTLGKLTEDGAPSPAEEACLFFNDLHALFHRYAVTVHNVSPRRGRPGTPLQRYLSGIVRWPVRMPENEDVLDAAVSLRESRKLLQTGIEYASRFYRNDDLDHLWNTVEDGSKVHFRVNPLDVRSILVLHPVTNQFIRVPSTRQEAWPITLSYHLQLVARAKELGLDPTQSKQLAVAEQALRDSFRQMAAKARKQLRRKDAEMMREARLAGEANAVSVPRDLTPVLTGESLVDRLSKLSSGRSNAVDLAGGT